MQTEDDEVNCRLSSAAVLRHLNLLVLERSFAGSLLVDWNFREHTAVGLSRDSISTIPISMSFIIQTSIHYCKDVDRLQNNCIRQGPRNNMLWCENVLPRIEKDVAVTVLELIENFNETFVHCQHNCKWPSSTRQATLCIQSTIHAILMKDRQLGGNSKTSIIGQLSTQPDRSCIILWQISSVLKIPQVAHLHMHISYLT